MFKILLPILAKVGVPILVNVVKSKSPKAGQVLERIGNALGVTTEEEIAKKYEENPDAVAEVIREVESSDPEKWKMMENADTVRGEEFAREHEEGMFAWAWRPGWMYLLGVLWTGAAIAKMTGLEYIDFATLLGLTGIYTTLYMGGHTLKGFQDKMGG